MTSFALESNAFKKLFTAMPLCPALSSIRASVPDVIWTATNPDPNMTLAVGSTFSFKCPDGLQVQKVFLKLI
jgi:hypothetical protein